MNKRMLDGSIWANEKFSDMPPMACLLQIGIINLADDQGRCKAHPLYLRSQIFPYRDVTVDEVSMWLGHIVANGTAVVYQVDGKDYLQLLNWWQYQSHSFAQPSDYPRPEGWQDRVRFTGKSRVIYTCNWIISNGETLEDTCDQDGHPLQKPNKPHGRPPSQPLAPAPSQPPGEPVTPLIEAKDKEEAKAATPALPAESTKRRGDDETALISMAYHAIGSFAPKPGTSPSKNAIKVAGELLERYGFEKCARAMPQLQERHYASVKDKNQGISAPVSYLVTLMKDSDITAPVVAPSTTTFSLEEVL